MRCLPGDGIVHWGVVGTGSGIPDYFVSQPLWPYLPTGSGKRVHHPPPALEEYSSHI